VKQLATEIVYTTPDAFMSPVAFDGFSMECS
jgi:hypothetical protein